MSPLQFIIFDMETDGLYDEVTRIHCISFQKYQNKEIIERGTIASHEKIIEFFNQDCYFVGHNIIRYDVPVIEKLLGINLSHLKLVDTLGLSWYLFPKLKRPGLEFWGKVFNVPKPVIKDWANLNFKDYRNRCRVDVEINVKVFKFFFNYLSEIYGSFDQMLRIIGYINFKLDCLKEQEFSGIPLNEVKAQSHLASLEEIFQEKTEILSELIPDKYGTIIKTKPAKMFKKDGSLSHYGEKWVELTSSLGLDWDSTDVIREKPNPGSHTQLKEWLFSLGWIPKTFKISKSTGEKIPQVSLPFGGGICKSVKKLYEIEPNLKELEAYYKIKHRISIFEGYLGKAKNGRVYSTAHGFTNTLRLTHSTPIVNLPKPGVYYGKEIREVLTIPDEDHIMCGADVSSLEDSTKQHFIYFYDPDYVTEMRIPGFDAHLDIGMLANLISLEESDFYKHIDGLPHEEKLKLDKDTVNEFKKVKSLRGTAKTANFAATYGAGGPKIAETAKISLKEGDELHRIYWERNWAVKETAKNAIVKIVNKQRWIYNPISGFWIYLKKEKDRFSTLNQNSGVYIFDSWVRKVRKKLSLYNIPVLMQYHDEIMLIFNKHLKDVVDRILHECMKEVNDEIKLNVEIEISTEYGSNYSETH